MAEDIKNNKKKLLCHACGTVSYVRMDKLPVHLLEITCPQCGVAIPLLNRISDARSSPSPVPVSAKDSTDGQTEFMEHATAYSPGLQETEDNEDESGWLMSFSDVMTQLLAFFILLTAISTIDRHKFDQAMQAIGQALGGGGTAKITATGKKTPDNNDLPPDWLSSIQGRLRSEQGGMDHLRNTLETIMAARGLSNDVAVHMDSDGLAVILQSAILFDEGSAEIRAEFKTTLHEIGLLLAPLPNQIVIEGHTDSKPIATPKYPSNWELSMQRAINVVKYYTDEQGLLNPARMIAAGVASYKPRYNVNSEDGYRNRRIEIHIKRDAADVYEKILRSH